MNEIIHITGNTYYINVGVVVGIYLDGSDCYLIDSGSSDDHAKKILKLIKEKNWNLKMIINTHHHADHIGGNAYLIKETGCKVYENFKSKPFLVHNELEIVSLWGSSPLVEHDNKFLKAKATSIESFSTTDLFEIVELPGHSVDMIGVITKDKVFFLGDLLMPVETISKYHINYLYDVKDLLDSIARIAEYDAGTYVIAHYGVVDDIEELVKVNTGKIMEISKKIMEVIDGGITFESLLKKVSDFYNIKLNSIQYLLISSTLKSYLKYMNDLNLVKFEYIDNYLYIIINDRKE